MATRIYKRRSLRLRRKNTRKRKMRGGGVHHCNEDSDCVKQNLEHPYCDKSGDSNDFNYGRCYKKIKVGYRTDKVYLDWETQRKTYKSIRKSNF